MASYAHAHSSEVRYNDGTFRLYDEKRTICLRIMIYIIDPKGLGNSNKIDSLRNSRTFFNVPNMFRRYIRLLSVTKSEITVKFKCCKVLTLVIFAVLLC